MEFSLDIGSCPGITVKGLSRIFEFLKKKKLDAGDVYVGKCGIKNEDLEEFRNKIKAEVKVGNLYY